MEPFCDNPKCKLNTAAVQHGDSHTWFRAFGVNHKVERFMHEDHAGKRFVLCSFCEEAVNFVKGAIDGFEEEDLLG